MNTRVKLGSALSLQVAQFSVGANSLARIEANRDAFIAGFRGVHGGGAGIACVNGQIGKVSSYHPATPITKEASWQLTKRLAARAPVS